MHVLTVLQVFHERVNRVEYAFVLNLQAPSDGRSSYPLILGCSAVEDGVDDGVDGGVDDGVDDGALESD